MTLGMLERTFVGRDSRHWLMEVTIRFDDDAAFIICISGLVTVSGRQHFQIGKSANKGNKKPTIIKNIDYPDSSEALQLIILEKRRIKGDLIQFLK